MTGSSIVRSDDLRNENRRRVLRCIRSTGQLSPAQLSRDTGLSAASISSLIAQLSEQGIVTSIRKKVVGASRGRPQSQIALHAAAGDIITVNLSIDRASVQRVAYANEVRFQATRDINSRTLTELQWVTIIFELVQEMIDTDADIEVKRIGVAFQGLTENESGLLLWSPIIQHQNIHLGQALREKFKLPVTIDNDCTLIARGLSDTAGDTLSDSFATILFSDGVGLGLFIDGKPFTGIQSSALELGHLRFERNGALCRCGRKGCIEAYAADYGVKRLAAGQSIHDDPSGRVKPDDIAQLCEAGHAGQTAAKQAFAIAGAGVGEGILTLFTLLDRMPVALVGRSQSAIDLMREGIVSVFGDTKDDQTSINDLLHCFEDATPLIELGLINNTLALLDNQFAHLSPVAVEQS